MSPQDEEYIKGELMNCKSVGEMFTFLQNNFDLENTKPPFLLKSRYVKGIMDAIKFVNPKPKQYRQHG